ncbi:CRISPR-associated endonuclease Cas2 [Pseudoalteromonas sp. MMG013]|uniref:CRISPR-associated endonuclease Cas2 n=1 Tax=unclassified Pseudoalteromonas TaxID=194690 RepID=UPI001B36EF88|nr:MULTISPECIES: CRISPR-associated endonuclease Cas2 [unclassified Pseudoalteromonas]MBQ4849779.1 CRISPR-associated endonuclease Cas2 [Pseudoalteromonas sp. MMG012]MBQ4863007.1 CRISPR-associated endonuclease Cas2 [Pseudoalteromonas sp. MMG013]
MRVLVTLDITSPRVRYRANKLILGYGERVQYSVFEIDVTQKQLNQIHQKLKKLLKRQDKAHLFPLCGKCMGSRKADGAGEVTWPEHFYYY